MEHLDHFLSELSSLSQQDKESKAKKTKSLLTVSALSNLLQEKHEWVPFASSGTAENPKLVELSEEQVTLLSNYNNLSRVSGVLRILF